MSVGAVNKQTGDRIPTAGMPAIDNALSLISTNPVQNAIITAALAGKQDKLTFDDTPTDNSNNPVKSNGIYDALALKQNATDNNLQTTDKTVVGAINEHEGDINSLKSGLTGKQNDLNLAGYAENLNFVPTGICVADRDAQNTPVAGHRFVVFTARCYIDEYGFSLQWAYDHDDSNKIYTRTEWASWSAWMVVSTT